MELEEIRLERMTLSRDLCSMIGRIETLKKIELDGCRQVFVSSFKNLPHLREIALIDCKLKSQDVKDLLKFRVLAEVNLKNNLIIEQDLKLLQEKGIKVVPYQIPFVIDFF